MSPSNTKATVRMVAASFAAGVSAMVMFGLIAPVVVQGGLSVREAMASPVEQRPEISLDVEAVHAQLADAERAMDAARETTADDIRRLQRLSGR